MSNLENKNRSEDTETNSVADWWDNLSLKARRRVIATGAAVAIVIGFVALNQLEKDAPSDAEFLEWEKQNAKNLAKKNSDWEKTLKAKEINPRFEWNIGEAYDKFGKELDITKEEWDAEVLKTTRFVERFEKANAIETFMVGLVKRLKREERGEILTEELKNELKIQLLTGSSSTISYEEALEDLK
jgi:hypothetical protein